MMATQIKSTNTVFVNGRRYRPGEVFELPDGVKLAAGMQVLTPSEQKVSKAQTEKPKRKSKSDETDTFSAIAKRDGALGLGSE